MTDKNVEKLDELGFQEVGIVRIGKIGGYFFEVEDKQDAEDELIIAFNFAPNSSKSKLFEYFDKLEENKAIKDYSLEKNKIFITYTEDEEDVGAFLNELAAKIAEIDGKCICSNCENTENLSFYSNKIVYSLLCDDCGTDLMNQLDNDKKSDPNYVKGFLASLIGGLIGSALWILIGSFGFFASIAGFAISYCAFKGYGLVKGKFSRAGIILNVIAIIIAFLFAQYAGIFIELAKEYENLTFQKFLLVTPDLFTDLEFLKALIPDMGLGLLFVFLGTYRTISQNYKSARNVETMKVEKLEL